MDSRPIGVFDSGIGGLTVLSKLRRRLPNEDFLYFADTARIPYGRKPPQMVRQFAKEITNFLIDSDVKAIVIACNTATSLALDTLKQQFDLPIWGVVEAGANAAKKVAKVGDTIGIIGTNGTIKSESYQNLLKQNGFEVWAKACPLLAPLVEEGLADSDMAEVVVKHYLADMPSVSCLILGCTHYPILAPVIKKQIGKAILVDSAVETAEMVVQDLKKFELLNQEPKEGTVKHFVSGDLQAYRHTAEIIGGISGKSEHIDILDLDISRKKKQLSVKTH